ncbi:mucin-3A-like [Cyprinodon tularosa]|uniref:mucin-3A-like n=1 Tax=Cyprinodon tularosa TaxID=77115 RepID=UPI0018E1DBD6|nr:mucin-3A-like [Cyprinodon tularosa]
MNGGFLLKLVAAFFMTDITGSTIKPTELNESPTAKIITSTIMQMSVKGSAQPSSISTVKQSGFSEDNLLPTNEEGMSTDVVQSLYFKSASTPISNFVSADTPTKEVTQGQISESQATVSALTDTTHIKLSSKSGTAEQTSTRKQNNVSATMQSSVGTTKLVNSTTPQQMESPEQSSLPTSTTKTATQMQSSHPTSITEASTVEYTSTSMLKTMVTASTVISPPSLNSTKGTSRKTTSSSPFVTTSKTDAGKLATNKQGTATTQLENSSKQLTSDVTAKTHTSAAKTTIESGDYGSGVTLVSPSPQKATQYMTESTKPQSQYIATLSENIGSTKTTQSTTFTTKQPTSGKPTSGSTTIHGESDHILESSTVSEETLGSTHSSQTQTATLVSSLPNLQHTTSSTTKSKASKLPTTSTPHIGATIKITTYKLESMSTKQTPQTTGSLTVVQTDGKTESSPFTIKTQSFSTGHTSKEIMETKPSTSMSPSSVTAATETTVQPTLSSWSMPTRSTRTTESKPKTSNQDMTPLGNTSGKVTSASNIATTKTTNSPESATFQSQNEAEYETTISGNVTSSAALLIQPSTIANQLTGLTSTTETTESGSVSTSTKPVSQTLDVVNTTLYNCKPIDWININYRNNGKWFSVYINKTCESNSRVCNNPANSNTDAIQSSNKHY